MYCASILVIAGVFNNLVILICLFIDLICRHYIDNNIRTIWLTWNAQGTAYAS